MCWFLARDILRLRGSISRHMPKMSTMLLFVVLLRLGTAYHIDVSAEIGPHNHAAVDGGWSNSFEYFTESGEKTQTQNQAAVDGGWSNWFEYFTESGEKTQTRSCNNPVPKNGGRACRRDSAIDGKWTEFSNWSACSTTCGVGEKVRFRTCTNPVPSDGGDDCQGQSKEVKSCVEVEYCPIDGNWTDFSDWSACSKTCGVGEKVRSRTCTNPPPCFGGVDCLGESEEVQSCVEVENCLCPANEATSDDCLCENRITGALQSCSSNQGCTNDGTCLDVCTADETNFAPCFCKSPSSDSGVACSSNKGCSLINPCFGGISEEDKLNVKIKTVERILKSIGDLQDITQFIVDGLKSLTGARNKRSGDEQPSEEKKLIDLLDEVSIPVKKCGERDVCVANKIQTLIQTISSTYESIVKMGSVSSRFQTAVDEKSEQLDRVISVAEKTQGEELTKALSELSQGLLRIFKDDSQHDDVHKWENNVVPYFFTSTSEKDKGLFRMVMKIVSENTCFNFEEVSISTCDVKLCLEIKTGSKSCSTGCQGFIGVTNPSFAVERILLQSLTQVYDQEECKIPCEGFALHELLHVLGSKHPFTRRDRDNFITVNETTVQKLGIQEIFKKCESCELNTPYDCNSIMNYGTHFGGFEVVTPKDIKTCMLKNDAKLLNGPHASDLDWENVNVNGKCFEKPQTFRKLEITSRIYLNKLHTLQTTNKSLTDAEVSLIEKMDEITRYLEDNCNQRNPKCESNVIEKFEEDVKFKLQNIEEFTPTFILSYVQKSTNLVRASAVSDRVYKTKPKSAQVCADEGGCSCWSQQEIKICKAGDICAEGKCLDGIVGCMTTPSRPDKKGNPSKGHKKCKFPFTFKGKTYNECAPGTVASNMQDESLWCSTKVDSRGQHVSGQGEWGFCNQACSGNGTFQQEWRQKDEEDCWSKCDSKGGSCPKFCGVGGFCCRKGYGGCPSGAAEASPKRHTCVTKSACPESDVGVENGLHFLQADCFCEANGGQVCPKSSEDGGCSGGNICERNSGCVENYCPYIWLFG